MADLTKYLDYAGLEHYDEKLKAFMAAEDAKVLQSAKDYTDALENGQVKTNKEAIELLNNTVDTEGSVKHSIKQNAKDAIYSVDAETQAITTIAEAIAAIDTESKIDVVKQDTAEEHYAATYVIKQNGTQVGTKINIPKDFLVKSAELKTVTEEDQPYEGAKVGDKYLDFVINTVDASEDPEHLYIPVNDLFDSYTSGSEATDMVVINVNNDNNTISASVTAGSITRDRITAGFESDIAKVETALQKAEDGTYKTVSTRVKEEAKNADYKEETVYINKTNPADIIDADAYAALTEEEKANYEASVIKSTIGNAIAALEEAIGEGGSVAQQIEEAINALDATKTQELDATSENAISSGLYLKVTEENGLLTGIEGKIETVTNTDIDALFPSNTTEGE